MILFSRAAVVAAALLVATLAAPVQAATTVAPGEYANADAPSAQFGIFGNISNSPTTFQFVVAASQLTGITQGAQISALGFRFAGTPFTAPEGAATYSQYSVQIGRALNGPSSLSTSFAANTGADTITARSGALTIPANTFIDLPGEGPNPFFDLGFSTPYTYSGGDLAVTIRFTPATGNPGIAVDAFATDARIGTVSAIGNAAATTGTAGTLNAPVVRFTFADATAVPEPASWALMIAGVGMVGGALRRRPARRAAIA